MKDQDLYLKNFIGQKCTIYLYEGVGKNKNFLGEIVEVSDDWILFEMNSGREILVRTKNIFSIMFK